MTQNKIYEFGPYKVKCYCKPVGNGYEVGFTYNNKPYFVGNFVHPTEAKKWWTTMNTCIMSFSKKYSLNEDTPFSWYCNFMCNHLYKNYYTFLDKVFTQHNRTYNKAFNQDLKKYNKQYRPVSKDTYYNFKRAA